MTSSSVMLNGLALATAQLCACPRRAWSLNACESSRSRCPRSASCAVFGRAFSRSRDNEQSVFAGRGLDGGCQDQNFTSTPWNGDGRVDRFQRRRTPAGRLPGPSGGHSGLPPWLHSPALIRSCRRRHCHRSQRRHDDARSCKRPGSLLHPQKLPARLRHARARPHLFIARSPAGDLTSAASFRNRAALGQACARHLRSHRAVIASASQVIANLKSTPGIFFSFASRQDLDATGGATGRTSVSHGRHRRQRLSGCHIRIAVADEHARGILLLVDHPLGATSSSALAGTELFADCRRGLPGAQLLGERRAPSDYRPDASLSTVPSCTAAASLQGGRPERRSTMSDTRSGTMARIYPWVPNSVTVRFCAPLDTGRE